MDGACYYCHYGDGDHSSTCHRGVEIDKNYKIQEWCSNLRKVHNGLLDTLSGDLLIGVPGGYLQDLENVIIQMELEA